MKNCILYILCLSVSFYSKAQDSTIVLSRFEQMATTGGNFYRIEEKRLGTVRGENVEVLRIRNIKENNAFSVIRLSSESWTSDYTPIVSNSNCYFEKEEIGEIIRILESYLNDIKNSEPARGTYFSYVTLNDVQIFCRPQQQGFSNSYLSFNKLYKYLRTP